MSESGLEQELKLVAAGEQVLDDVLGSDLVQERLDPRYKLNVAPIPYRGIYYDTPDGALGRQQCSLRARQEGDRLVAALKTAGVIENGLSSRMEYEAPLDRFPRTARELTEGELKREVALRIDLDQPLLAQVEVNTQRSIRRLVLNRADPDDCRLELVADRCVISAAGLTETLYEIELELKEGQLAPMLELGEQLRQRFPLTSSVRTKHEIGMQLRARALSS